MPLVEFKRGPLKGRSVGVWRENGALTATTYKNDSSARYIEIERHGGVLFAAVGKVLTNGNDTVDAWVVGGVSTEGIVVGHGRDKLPQETDFENESFHAHPSGLLSYRMGEEVRTYGIAKTDYLSPNRTIWGDFWENKKSITIETPQGKNKIPPGTQCFDMHFTPRLPRRSSDEFTYDISDPQIMIEGLSEYLRFLQDLQFDDKFKDVRVVSGITHPKMARLAIRRLGFALKNGQSVDFDSSDPKGNRKFVKIYGFKEDLIRKRREAYDLYAKLVKVSNVA